MARRHVSALERKIQEVKARVEKKTATEEEMTWLANIDTMMTLYGKPYKPNTTRFGKRDKAIHINPEKEKRRKRRRVGQYPDTPCIKRYHHPHSRRGI